jgi:hypothetical protein
MTIRSLVPPLAIATAALLAACTQDFPDDQPGRSVPNVGFSCPRFFHPCAFWSPDSKTLYRVSLVAAVAPGWSLLAIDPVTGLSHRVGGVDSLIASVVPSPNGASLYFAAAQDTTRAKYDVSRMTLADGATTLVTTAVSPDFLITPDGTGLAYRVPGGTATADTVALIDATTHAFKSATFVEKRKLYAFSSDGTRLIMSTGALSATAILVWHVTTGVRDTIAIAAGGRLLQDIKWSGTGFHLLLSGSVSTAYTDTSLAGGAATQFTRGGEGPFAWLPDRTAMASAEWETTCGQVDCNGRQYGFFYRTPTRATKLGSQNASTISLFIASPDGKWIAYEWDVGLSLLSNRTP